MRDVCRRILLGFSVPEFLSGKESSPQANKCMMGQLMTLKGPMWRRFLAISINVKIAETTARVLSRRMDAVSVEAVPAQTGNYRKQVISHLEVPAGRIVSEWEDSVRFTLTSATSVVSQRSLLN